MPEVMAMGQISIVDLTDTPGVSLTLTSNTAQTQIYDPNTNTFAPDWSTNNLTITPVVVVNGTQLDNTSSALSFTWKRAAGGGDPTNLITGESVTSGVLTVSANV